jgi:putative membrane protein
MAKLRTLIVVSALAVPLQLSAQANDSPNSSDKQNPDMQSPGSKSPREATGAKAPGDENTSQTKQAQKQFTAQTLSKIHQINAHEVEAGQLAQQRGQSAAVKNYGQTLVNDHQQLDDKLLSFAERNNIPLEIAQPSAGAASTKAQSEIQKLQLQLKAHTEKLQSIPDTQFDREFARAMVKGHQQAIQMVRSAQSQAKDAQFKSFLGDILPVLQGHLETAQQVQRQVSGGTATGSDTSSNKQ